MDPTAQPTQPQPTQPQPQPAQPQPIYSGEVYYTPPTGGRSLFSYKKSMYTVYPGWLILQDLASGAELHRIQLAPDIQFGGTTGQTRIKFLNGQKIGLTQVGYNFLFYSPMWLFLSYWVVFFKKKDTMAFIQAVKTGAGVPPTM